MTNYVQPGNILDMVTPAGGVLSGGVVNIGDFVGIAQTTQVAGELVAVALEGVFDVPKTTSQAWAVGAKLYWDTAAGKFTTTASTNVLAGHVALAAIAAAATGRIRLNN